MISEQLGDEELLAIRIGNGDIRVTGVDPELALESGSTLQISAPVESRHLFDGTSGAAIR